nr:hypothetical protein [Tanacetum cinerariifolium]
MCWGYDCRSWGRVWDGERGGKTGEKGLQHEVTDVAARAVKDYMEQNQTKILPTISQAQQEQSTSTRPLQDIPLEVMVSEMLTRMYIQPQIKKDFPEIFVGLLKVNAKEGQPQESGDKEARHVAAHDAKGKRKQIVQEEESTAKKIRRICAWSSQETAYVQDPIRRILLITYAVSRWSIVKDPTVKVIDDG